MERTTNAVADVPHHPTPAFPNVFTTPSIYLEDITSYANDVYAAMVVPIDRESFRPESRRVWHIAAQIHEDYSQLKPKENVDGRRVAFLLALDVLIAEPEAVQQALRVLRAELVKFDPALVLFAHGEHAA